MKKVVNIVVIILSIVAVLFIILNLFFLGGGFPLWIIPIGVICVGLTFYSKQKVLFVLSILLTTSFFWIWSIFAIKEAITIQLAKADESSFFIENLDFPEGTLQIKTTAELVLLLDKLFILEEDEAETMYIYFGSSDCSSCVVFENELETVLSLDGDLPIVYYYNMSLFPTELSKSVIETIDLSNCDEFNQIPYILKLENRIPVDSFTLSDKDNLNKLIK